MKEGPKTAYLNLKRKLQTNYNSSYVISEAKQEEQIFNNPYLPDLQGFFEVIFLT